MPDLSIRLRRATPGLLSLPWLEPLASWPADAAEFRELPVGPSRHTVRFVVADGVLYALKELPIRVARKEYRVLRELEARMLPAVEVVGLVEQPTGGTCSRSAGCCRSAPAATSATRPRWRPWRPGRRRWTRPPPWPWWRRRPATSSG